MDTTFRLYTITIYFTVLHNAFFNVTHFCNGCKMLDLSKFKAFESDNFEALILDCFFFFFWVGGGGKGYLNLIVYNHSIVFVTYI